MIRSIVCLTVLLVLIGGALPIFAQTTSAPPNTSCSFTFKTDANSADSHPNQGPFAGSFTDQSEETHGVTAH